MKELAEKLEGLGIRTYLTQAGVAISAMDAQKVKASALLRWMEEHDGKFYEYENGCGDCILRDAGLEGVYIVFQK